jgi:hypothetical protein
MEHLKNFKANAELINKYGESTAYLLWAMGLYLEESNFDELASECLTDGSNDKKIDFIKLDYDHKKIVFAQGYYTTNANKTEAPANKASDLNTGVAWLMSRDTELVPELLSEVIKDCRTAIENGDIDKIDLLYVHNLSGSINVENELTTVKEHFQKSLPKDKNIIVFAQELDAAEIETLYEEKSSEIVIKNDVVCPAKVEFSERTEQWEAGVLSVPGIWLKELYLKFGDKLFSANYRGFLGIAKRKKKNINSDIKNTAQNEPKNFWAFNNGVTILTNNLNIDGNKTTLTGISVINGAQTTGSLSSIENSLDLTNVKVLTRVIQCKKPEIIKKIIEYNNTQNEITSWDKFSNDPIQRAVYGEFANYGYRYSLKRGVTDSDGGQVGISSVIQPLASLMGYYREANRGKNGLFLSEDLYKRIFNNANARHILFAFCLNQAIDLIRFDLKEKKSTGIIIDIEEKQLALLKNLRFKNFYISVFAGCLDVLLGQKITNIKQVGFKSEVAKGHSNDVNALVRKMFDITNFVLIYTVASIKDIQQTFDDPEALSSTTNAVSTAIYATIATAPNPAVRDFRNLMLVG